MKTNLLVGKHLFFFRLFFFIMLCAFNLGAYAQCGSCSYEIEQDPACCPPSRNCACDDGWVKGHWDEFGSWSPGYWYTVTAGCADSGINWGGCNYHTVEEWNGGRNWDTRTADDRFGPLEVN